MSHNHTITPKAAFKILTVILVFQCVKLNAQFRILTPPTTIQKVEEMDADERGNILFATEKGILLLDTTNSWTVYNTGSGITNLHIKSVKHTQNGFIYSDDNKRLGSCDYITATDSVFGSGLGYTYISALYSNPAGDSLLAGTDNGKLLWYNGSSLNQLSLGNTLGTINDIIVGAPGHFFSFNSSNKGLLYQLPNNPFILLGTTSSYIPDNDILSSVSKNAIVYYGTGKGLFTVDYSNIPSFTYTVSNMANTPGLPSDTISALAIANGTVFIGTPKGLGIRANNTWTFYTPSNSNLPSSYISAIAVNSKNELFLSTKQGTICRFDTAAKGFVSVKKTQAPEAGINVYFNTDKALLSINSSTRLNSSLFIYTIDGRAVLSAELDSFSEDIQLSDFQNGLYFYMLKNKGGEILNEGKLLYIKPL